MKDTPTAASPNECLHTQLHCNTLSIDLVSVSRCRIEDTTPEAFTIVPFQLHLVSLAVDVAEPIDGFQPNTDLGDAFNQLNQACHTRSMLTEPLDYLESVVA